MDLLTEHRREHIKEMIESGFYPSKERFIELCDGTYSRKEICDILGISTSTFKLLRRYFELPPKKRKIDMSTYEGRYEKAQQTWLKKYGDKNYFTSQTLRSRGVETFKERYGDMDGEPYKNMIKKRFDTLSSNGKDAVLSSSQQRYIRDLFNGELNYLFCLLSYRCLFKR